MAFAKPDILGKEVAIATAFYVKKEKKPDPGVPAFLADLVTNEKADILATAYAPRGTRLCQGLALREPAPGGECLDGRFVPPLAKGDHAWMSQPLPAERLLEGRAELPGQRDLFRGARREPERARRRWRRWC